MSGVAMRSGEVQVTPPLGIDEEDIRAQLERIESSCEFDAPERLRSFLRYVVEESLAGRSDRIKAYTIAIEVFGRDSDFDTRNDPVVRIEAGRLRRALERYYLVAGQGDPVVIDIPKGGYAPTFSVNAYEPSAEPAAPGPVEQSLPPPDEPPAAALPRRRWWPIATAAILVAGLLGVGMWAGTAGVSHPWGNQSAGEAVPQGPSLLVRPFSSLGGDAEGGLYAAGLTDEVLSQLAWFRELRVMGRETSRSLSATADAVDIPAEFGARYVLEGTVKTSGGGVRVNARVLDSESAFVLWARTYEADLTSGDIVDVVVDIAAQVAAAVAQPYGIIFRADERRSVRDAPDDLAGYRCTLRFYRYRAVLSADEHAAVRDCLEQTVARYPGYGTAWAMLSYVYLDEDRFEFNRRAGEPAARERALKAARHAVRLDPDNIRALQALMMALFFSGDAAESLRVGEQALALNPNDTELLGELGSRVAQAGDWRRGSELLGRALALNPGNSGYYAGMLALAAFMQHENARAVSLIRQADLMKFPLFHVVAALIYSEAGLEEAAAESRTQFLEMRPRFFDDLEAELAKRNFSPEDKEVLVNAARKAGFPVD